MFNTYQDLYRGMKNSLMVELVVFSVLFILHLGECSRPPRLCDYQLMYGAPQPERRRFHPMAGNSTVLPKPHSESDRCLFSLAR